MATFSVTAPTTFATSELVVQGVATNTISQGLIPVQGIGIPSPVANSILTTVAYAPDSKFTVVKPKEFTKVRLRPAYGQVYPRTV